MRILLVEDEIEIVELWSRFLSDIEGAEFYTAPSIKKALEEMGHKPPPDLILLDLNLEDSRGIETLDQIAKFKKMNPFSLVLVVTGIPDDNIGAQALIRQADGFGIKADIGTQKSLWKLIGQALTERQKKTDKPLFAESAKLFQQISRTMSVFFI